MAPSLSQGIKADMEGLLSSLIGQGLIDDQNFPYLRQVSSDCWEVTWSGAEHISVSLANVDYFEIHRELSDKRSYTAKLIDGALLQMMYLFEEENLIKHRLAYFPSPSLRPFLEEPETYLRDEVFVEIVSRRIIPFPIRFDFDIAAAQNMAHPICHLTLGDIENCRIPVSAPLTPRWFVEFVIRNFYHVANFRFADFLPNHRCKLNQTITIEEAQMIHLVVNY